MAFDIKNYKAVLGTHKGKDIIWVEFSNNIELKNELKAELTTHWSNSKKCWYVKDTQQYRKLFGLPEKTIGKQAVAHIHPVNQKAFRQFLDLLQLKAYSPKTIQTYANEFAQFLFILKHHSVEEIESERVKKYILYCIHELKLSENSIHSRLNALKFYFEQMLHREKFFVEIPRPKKALNLPKVLSIQEVKRLFDAVDNLKHLMILKLVYGMGLRVSEIIALKIQDIDSNRMQAHIERAKGKKSRYVTLPDSILEELRTYFRIYKPKGPFLFEGQYGGAYSVRSVQLVFKNALRKANINKNVGIHSLRHSYATHLLEAGTDISLIQKLLGHNDIKTTLIYTHVGVRDLVKVKSPLDSL